MSKLNSARDAPQIVPYAESMLDTIVALSLRAWAPVFPKMQAEMPDYVYAAFYPSGWEARQRDDVMALCRSEDVSVFVAQRGGEIAGFTGLRVHEEDSMGEVHIIAVDPAHQRAGVGEALMTHALEWMRDRGLAMAMVETGGDEGHAPSRALYETCGFRQAPVARYFRKL